MEFDKKLKQERHKILCTFLDQWIEGEQAKRDKIKDEISELEEQCDNCILQLAKDDFPDKEINSIEDIDRLLLLDSDRGFYKEARQKYSSESIRQLYKEIGAKQMILIS